MPAKKTAAPTTDRSTYKWSEAEVTWLAKHLGEPRNTMVPAFRKAFPDLSASDTAIQGKAYHLANGTGVRGLDQKIAALEARLDDCGRSVRLPTRRNPPSWSPRPRRTFARSPSPPPREPPRRDPQARAPPGRKPRNGKVTLTKAS